MNITKIAILSGGESQSIYEMGVSPFRALSEIDSCEVTYIDYKSIYSEVGPRRSNSKIYRTIGEVLPDIVLWISDYHYEFDIEFFLKLSQQSFMALFVGDDENYFDKHSRYYSQAFDLVITANPLSVDRYGIYGVPAVPYYSAYNTSQIKLNKNIEEFKNNVSFVGLFNGKVGRKEYLSFLDNNNIDVQVYGGGFPKGIISRDKMNMIYKTSKINLNFSGVSEFGVLDREIKINRRIKQIKGRCQEIALSGGFVLSEYAPGIENVFEIGPGKEIDVFYSRSELLDKIDYYLKNEDIRIEMSLKAHKRALNDCDEINQWRYYIGLILDNIDSPLKRNEFVEVYVDPMFKKAYSAYHLANMLSFFLRFKLRNMSDEFLMVIKYPLIDVGVFISFLKRYIILHPIMQIIIKHR